jgi:molecular chaperone DnaK
MDRLAKRFSSPEKKAARFEKDLRSAVLAHDRQKIASAFGSEFQFLLRERRAEPLSGLILEYLREIEDVASFEKNIPSGQLRQAISFLTDNQFDPAALMLCDFCGYKQEAIELLARRGRANELAVRLSQDNVYDKELLHSAVTFWEKYNGDISMNPTWEDVLINIAKFAPESIPDNPRVKEIAGQFKEAAILYAQEGELRGAARCYERAGMYVEASAIYERLGDNEHASQAAESAGDLERALAFAVKPERRLKLLIRLERFIEAREYAAGVEKPDEYFDLIKTQAKQRLAVRMRAHDYGGALELAALAEIEPAEKQTIVLLGRQEFDQRIISAASQDDLQTIYRDRIAFEEKAGHFEEAGKLAEEVLGDHLRASFLYEKANLYNRAIEAVSEQMAEQADGSAGSIRLAELHERGGNLLKAARLYETAGRYDKAAALFESARRFDQAIACYLKTALPSQDVLARLYTAAGEYEKLTELYMTSGSFPDLETALAVATTHQLTSHVRVIRERMAAYLVGSEKDLERCFARAKDEICRAYSSIVGIDFGTTNSVAAIFNKASGKVEVILTAQGSELEPSYFGVDDDNHPIFGEAARLRSLTAPHCVAARVKRNLGEKGSVSINGRRYGYEEVVANFLRQLRANAEAYVQAHVTERFHALLEQNNLKFPAEVLQAFLDKQPSCYHAQDVVLSVPAYFNDNQKRATRDSAEIAGLRVRRLLHEPTAAALAYCKQKPYSGTLTVIDLGGGTLDVSIVDIGEGVAEVRAVGGDPKLGGSDIDALLVQQVVKNIRELWGIEINEKTYPLEMARLQDACETLKVNLSSVTQGTLELAHFLNRPRYTYTLTRAELEALAAPVLTRVQAAIEATIKDYGAKVDHFQLIGNATKMPAVIDLVKTTLPVKQLLGIDPGTAVATGAALEGAVLAGDSQQILLLDIVPYSLGVAAMREKDENETMSRLIEKNSTIPIAKSNVFSTKDDNQPNVHIKVYQGEAAQPQKNYFLGDFVLEGIPPAPARAPQIEVTFAIGADCILTVRAVDKATGNTRSIKIESAVVLSPHEKQTLRHYFAQKEASYSFEESLEKVRSEIGALKSACHEALDMAERAIHEFFERFHERVEINARLYRANPEQTRAIQDMFIQKEQFVHGIPQYRDRFASILRSLQQAEARHLDFTDNDLVAKLQDRIDTLSNYKQALENLNATVENDVIRLVAGWVQILEALEPDAAAMSPLEAANYHLVAGKANLAKDILLSLAASTAGLTEEAFCLLLKCQVQLGLREEYRDTHKRFGRLFGLVYPDFYRLNLYLKSVDDSIFMIQGVTQQHGILGSGFCIAPNLIVTNRHVLEGVAPFNVRIIGKQATYHTEELVLDPINDIAILRVSENLKPLRLGEFSFVEPGEQVLAIGFPMPGSAAHGENLFISQGIVNSIRKIPASTERVIFIDTKIGSGMSGGPLINDLGEVVGMVTFIQYDTRQGEGGPFIVGEQPVALPIHLVRKYTMRMC